MYLATRVASQIPEGESRNTLYNLEATQGILRALPPISAATAQNTYASLSARLGRACTVSELTRALYVYQVTFENDLRANGAPVDNRGKGKQGDKKDSTPPNPTTFAVKDNGSKPDGNVQQMQNPNKQGNGQHKKGHGKKGWNKKQNGGNGNNGQNTYNTSYCSLCGKSDHTSTQGCPYIVDDSGAVKSCFPTHNPCPVCPPSLPNKLHHPTVWCPYRAGGPFHGMA
jgi:hypothetical protein